jgi:hypothetical protein
VVKRKMKLQINANMELINLNCNGDNVTISNLNKVNLVFF